MSAALMSCVCNHSYMTHRHTTNTQGTHLTYHKLHKDDNHSTGIKSVIMQRRFWLGPPSQLLSWALYGRARFSISLINTMWHSMIFICSSFAVMQKLIVITEPSSSIGQVIYLICQQTVTLRASRVWQWQIFCHLSWQGHLKMGSDRGHAKNK